MAAWGIFALAAQWIANVEKGNFLSNGLAQWNFFFYFTIETNIMIALWFLLAGLGLAGKLTSSAAARGAVLVYGTVTVAVYWALLAGAHNPGSAWGYFANYSLHLGLPLAMWVDLFLNRPAAGAGNRAPFFIVAFPLAYGVFSLLRGAVTGWYPYFFINPGKMGGALPTTLSILGLLAFFLGAGFLMRLAWNRLARGRS